MAISIDPSPLRPIPHWGEMSSRWGINRSMTQIHAQSYLSEQPLNAKQIDNLLKLTRLPPGAQRRMLSMGTRLEELIAEVRPLKRKEKDNRRGECVHTAPAR